MPRRKLKVPREIRMPFYWMMVGLATVLVTPMLVVAVSVKIADNNLAAVERQRAAAAEQSRVLVCSLLGALLDVFDETPPPTEAGRKVQATYLEFYVLAKCQPPRKAGTR